MKKIILIFIKPRRVFEELKEKPEFINPLILSIIIGMLSSIFRTLRISGIQIPSQFPFLKTIAIIFSTISISITIFINSLIIFLILLIIGFRGKFKNVLSIVFYSYLPNLIRILLNSIFSTRIINTASISQGQNLSILNLIVSKFDLFSVWSFILTLFGLIILFNMRKNKIILYITTYFLIFILLPTIASYYILPKVFFTETTRWGSNFNLFRIFRFFRGTQRVVPPIGGTPPGSAIQPINP
jgi:hypothetical protein